MAGFMIASPSGISPYGKERPLERWKMSLQAIPMKITIRITPVRVDVEVTSPEFVRVSELGQLRWSQPLGE